jgi:hypothetical protein
MLNQSSRRYFSKWMHERLATSMTADRQKTVALLVHHDEIKDKSLSCLDHLHHSQDWRHDLSLNKSCWFYTNDATMRRCLLLQYKPEKEKEGESGSDDSEVKTMRQLGAHAVSQL